MSPQGTEGRFRLWALVRAWPSSALHLWRRSLRTRVVTAIVVLSAVVVGSVGFMVMRQISSGLVKGRVDSSVAEARTETSTARELLNSAGGSDYDPETQLRLLAENLVSRGEVKGFDVVVRGPVGTGSTAGGVRTTPAVDIASVPANLGSRVEDGGSNGVGSNGVAWAYTRIRHLATSTTGRVDEPGVAVG